MEPAVAKFQEAVGRLGEMLTRLAQPMGSKKKERELWRELDRMWLDVKDLLVSTKHTVRQAGDKELSKEISKLLPQTQSAFRIAQRQSSKQKDHQPAIDFLQGFQNQVSNLQTKLYGTV
jgi:hypothetical protein